MILKFRHAEDNDRYFIMDVRNAGRQNMTHYTGYITHEDQDDWWFSEQRKQFCTIWIAELHDQNEQNDVGFCMIREHFDSGRMYGTLAVDPQYQGFGIGTAMYQWMIRHVEELWIDIRKDNLPSIKAALKAGFTLYNTGLEVLEMVYRHGD